MLSLLLPLALLTSTLAAPASPALPGHHHRLGRRSQTFLPAPQRLPHAHAGRLSGSRVDMREHSAVGAHDTIPDSGEIWELPDESERGYVLQAELDGRRGAQLGEEMITKAWTSLISPPIPTGVDEEEDGERRSWFEGEYVGELHEGEEELEELEGGWWGSWWGEAEGGEAGYDGGADHADWAAAATASSELSSGLRSERLQIAAHASAPVGGWAVNPRGEWYLAHLD